MSLKITLNIDWKQKIKERIESNEKKQILSAFPDNAGLRTTYVQYTNIRGERVLEMEKRENKPKDTPPDPDLD